jgi:hemolysin activation/secretion protein
MTHNQKTSQVLIGVLAGLFITQIANAAGVGANNAAQDAAMKSLAAQDKALKEIVAPKASPTAALVKPAKAEPHKVAEGADKIRFVLGGLNIEGNTAIPTEDLKKFYAGVIGKEIALSEVYKIAEDIETHYRMKGYEFSRVLVPAQKASGGIIRLVVVETVVGKVNFDGHISGRGDVLDLIRARLLASKPLRNADLERYVLLLNDVAGVDATATLSKSDIPNATDVTFTLKAKPFDIAVVADNSKPKNLGTQQGVVFASLNNALGMYEKISITGALDPNFKKSRYVRGALGVLVYGEGTYATVSGNYSDTSPVDAKGLENTTGENKGFDFDIKHPFMRSRTLNLSLHAGFDYKNSKTTVTGLKPVETDIRSINIGGTFDVADFTGGVTLVDVSGEIGLDALSATPSLTDAVAVGKAGRGTNKAFANNYTKFDGTISRLQTFSGAPGLSLQFGLTGQYALSPLPSMKEFAIGGREWARGLDSGLVTGDNGFAGKAELRFAIPQDAIKTLQPYGFLEYGATWQRDDKVLDPSDSTKFQTQVSELTLSSWTVGAGLKVDIVDNASFYLEGAWVIKPSDALKNGPLKTDETSGDLYDQANANARFFAGLTLRY